MALAAATYAGLFRLPFLVPPRRLLVSASYVFGFNNAIAVASMAMLLGMAAMYSLTRWHSSATVPLRFTREGATRAPSGWLFTAIALLYSVLTLAMYRYGQGPIARITWESRHFIYRMKLMIQYGLRPYVDFHEEYGPGLTYPPVYAYRALAPFGVSVEAAYFVCHLLMNLAGIACLFYLLRSISASRTVKAVTFVIIAVAGFGPWMGLNGVVLRYSLPFASILFGHRLVERLRAANLTRRWMLTTLVLVILLASNALLSADTAIAFAIAWTAYAVLAARSDRSVLAVTAAAMLVTGLIWAAAWPPEYYASVLRFSEGANNLPLLPAPHIVLYVMTLYVVVPRLLASGWRSATDDAPVLGALGVLIVTFIPGAFGRSDAPHVLYYGLGATALALPMLAQQSRRAATTYGVAYVAVFIGLLVLVNVLGVPAKAFVLSPVATARGVYRDIRSEFAPRDRSYLSALDKYPGIGLPFATYGYDNDADAYLLARRQVDPEYYVALMGVYSEQDIARKLRDVARHEYVLIGQHWEQPPYEDPCANYLDLVQQSITYPVRLRCVRRGLDVNAELSRFIGANYREVEQVGSTTVMRRVPPSSHPDTEPTVSENR
jgi:hypothetical protein